jgi:hypothetical protein
MGVVMGAPELKSWQDFCFSVLIPDVPISWEGSGAPNNVPGTKLFLLPPQTVVTSKELLAQRVRDEANKSGLRSKEYYGVQ